MTLENQVPPTQAEQTEQTPNPQDGRNGVEKRIDQITAKLYEERNRSEQLQAEIIKAQQQTSEALRQLAQNQQQAQPKVDPFAAYRDRVDPATLEAMQATMEVTRRQLEAETAAKMKSLEMANAVYRLRSEAQAIPGLPPEVRQAAETLFMGWRQAGWDVPTEQDAINIALGDYQRKQFMRAGGTMAYQNPNIPTVTPGIQPPPVPQAAKARPANFDSLSRAEQNLILDKMGGLDDPL